MARPKVIHELSQHLARMVEAAVQAGAAEEPKARVHWIHPQDVDKVDAGILPVIGLYLLEVAPEARLRSSGAALESGERPAPESLPSHLRRVPLWIACRYVISFRGRHPAEEQELLAAVLQLLYDQPLLAAEALPSLEELAPLAGMPNRFPIGLPREPELWRILGLSRHRLLLLCEVVVPLPSLRREPARRVLERQLELELLESREDAGKGE
ncbi:MAG: DUF4255 domain-containing protein [Planctomycetes bacterium]|nr:DUF4255 domain-containing protein [Planctomycetota bacterium]